MKQRKKYIVLIFFTFLAIFTLLLGKVIIEKDSYSPEPSDAAIILGHSLVDGKTPDTLLLTRLSLGLSLYEQGLCQRIIVSGGKGPTDKIPVAAAMRTWLISHQVAPEDILIEANSTNTYENLVYTKEIADTNGIQSVIIVTSDFHIYRSMLMAEKIFPSVSGAAASSSWSSETFLWYLKEPFSLVKYFLTA